MKKKKIIKKLLKDLRMSLLNFSLVQYCLVKVSIA